MPHPFERRYTDEQKDAVAAAYADRCIRPASRVRELAARGELEHNGTRLEPFEVKDEYIRTEAARLRNKRLGLRTSQLAQAPPRDAIEALRRRLINAADALLQDIEKQLQKDASRVDPEKLRQVARAAREIQAMPGPDEPRRPAPGQRVAGKREGAETQGGLGGKLIAAHRQGDPQPAQDATHRDSDARQNANAAQGDEQPQNDATDNEPGSLVRELAVRLAGPAAGAT